MMICYSHHKCPIARLSNFTFIQHIDVVGILFFFFHNELRITTKFQRSAKNIRAVFNFIHYNGIPLECKEDCLNSTIMNRKHKFIKTSTIRHQNQQKNWQPISATSLCTMLSNMNTRMNYNHDSRVEFLRNNSFLFFPRILIINPSELCIIFELGQMPSVSSCLMPHTI